MAYEKKKSFFGRIGERIEDLFIARPTPDEDMLDELEEILVTSDIGVETTEKIIDELRNKIRSNYLWSNESVRDEIKNIVYRMVDKGERLALSEDYPLIILVIGVNGVGKTTSIAKLAYKLKNEGKSVILVAADTFRAAAAQQLSVWGERLGVPVIKHGEGADPSAVIFDGLSAAKARGSQAIIVDTAGRLQNKKNLMNELSKMYRVIEREYPEASKEVLLVLDATTGKNAISQAKEFGDVTDLTGIILTKLDGSAKGGIVITLADDFDLPVKFIGLGEKEADLAVFDPKEFSDSIFGE
ncbi:MAG: signal recognition particle-docking protein FtsY [Firmicutes bacterium]|nr:signal recognition particle-docking protein FtsY [Bacillota bacterium]